MVISTHHIGGKIMSNKVFQFFAALGYLFGGGFLILSGVFFMVVTYPPPKIRSMNDLMIPIILLLISIALFMMVIASKTMAEWKSASWNEETEKTPETMSPAVST